MTPLVLPSAITSGLVIDDALVLRVESKTGVLLTVPLADAVMGPKPKAESKKGKGSKKGSKKAATTADDAAKEALVAAAGVAADAPPLVLYAHISKVSDKRVTNLGGTYNVGSRIRARCIGVSPLDGVVSVTLNPTVIDQDIMWYDDLSAGKVVTGEVLAIEAFGLKVKLAPNVRAICPTLHLADTNVSDPSKKFTGNALIS
jgi:predicted RNA-binding protein with RPS1 domain